jgi:glycosyltransferase involved in cell wall biosynthesis
VKIAILSVQVPFQTGGAEVHAAALQTELINRGCEAEIVTLPFKWYPPERLLDCMLMARLVDVREVNGSSIDRIIALKFPAYFAPHPNKVCWVLHQHRQAYDLYGTELSDLWQSEEGRAVAVEIKRWDDLFLPQSKRIFANSRTVARRLKRFNDITAVPLYHPPLNHAAFRTGRFDPYILYPGRFDAIKRQALLFEALAYCPDGVQLVFCGQHDSTYGRRLVRSIESSEFHDRVRILGRISEAHKIDLYANCLAVYNGVLDEDYGYVTLEAFCAGKPVITHSDSGGPLEFVVHDLNGFVTEPHAEETAAAISALAADTTRAAEMGRAGNKTLEEMNISWDYTIEQLLQS